MKALKILTLIPVVILILSSAAAASDVYGTAVDPSYIGVGARPLGMGKAYCALAEDASSIFVNPAGLAKVDEMLFSSMYSNLMEEVNYTVGSVTYPVGPGTLAIGYLGVSVPKIDLYTVDGSDNPVSAGSVDYNNTVIYASYGSRLIGLNPDIMVGGNLKSFSQGFTNNDLTSDGTGTGMNADLGVLYQPNNWFTCGLTQQNLLLGSKMQFAGGIKEDMPSLTKAGMNVTLLGRYGFIRSPYKLNLTSDIDLGSGARKEATLHLGAEFWPVEMLAIRAGVDQDPVAGSVVSNLTAGVGLRLGNIQFDYAYHTYYDIPQNTTHFFSISFVGPFDKPKPRKNLGVTLETPREKTVITYEKKYTIEGKIDEIMPGDRLEVNGKAMDMDENGRFSTSVNIDNYGAKKVLVKAIDAKGKSVIADRTILLVASFSDVAENFWARKPIELLGTAGLISGYPDGTFKPDRTLTRAELATLLVKAKGMPVPEEINSAFSDVPASHWAARYIEAAVNAGLVKGYPDKTFRPDAKINKAEGITVMARLEGLDEMAIEMKDDAADSRFTDLANCWAGGYVLAADSVGLLEYLGEADKFSPNVGFTRAEAAEILSKTTLGQERVTALTNGKGTTGSADEIGLIVK